MTTPRDAIAGLTDYLRKAAMALYLAIDQTIADELSPKIKEAATQLDSLLKERDELQQVFDSRWEADQRAIKARQAAHSERPNTWPDHADMVVWLLKERDALQARVKELDLRYLGAVAARRILRDRAEKTESRALRAEQERDEAYERAIQAVRDERLIDPVDSHDQTYNDALGHAEQAIRRLAGPEKIAAPAGTEG